jgi:hypothetical protein
MILEVNLTDFFIGVGASLLASFIFLFLILFTLAPSIKISQFIVKRTGVSSRNEPDKVYVFKFVNKSFFKCFDINLELFKLERLPQEDGKWDTRFKRMEMVESSLKFVPGFWYFGSINNAANFAVLPKTFEDIESLIDDDHVYLQLQITARHGLTGLSRVFKKDFAIARHCIKTEKHKHGKHLGIL